MDGSKLFKTKYVSVAITVTIVLMLILSGPANAVRMEVSVDNNKPTQGEEITFVVTANIAGTDKYVPMDNFSLLLSKEGSPVRNVVFAKNGTILSNSTGISIVPIEKPSSSEYGYGDGRAMDDRYGYGYGTNYSFGYGYGYAANNGAGGSTLVYEYNVTIDTSSFDTGEYDAQVMLNTGNDVKSSFESLETSFTISGKEADISEFVESNGKVNTTFNVVSAEGNVNLTVPNGTIALDSGGNALNTSISIGTTSANSTMTLALSSSESIVGKVVELGPAGATFDPYIQVRFDYDDTHISGLDESKLGIKYYNTSTSQWESQTVIERNTAENYLIANLEHFSNFAIVGTAQAAEDKKDDPVRSGGGGSSGGGIASGEGYKNILAKEVQNAYVYKGSKVMYEFGETENPIKSVQFFALTNSGRVAASIEVLQDRSSYVDSDAPGKIYRQMNIWVGTPGQIGSDVAKDFLISFKVERSWLEDNNIDAKGIKLYRYADNNWNALPTSQTNADKEYVYFESQTPGFSPFAIVAVNEDSTIVLSEGEGDEDDDSAVEFGNETRESGDKGLPGFEALTLVFSLATVVFMSSRYKRKGER